MRWSPLVVGVLAILAGCQAPVSPAEPTATTGPPPSVEPTGINGTTAIVRVAPARAS